jgi:hypothetical protein
VSVVCLLDKCHGLTESTTGARQQQHQYGHLYHIPLASKDTFPTVPIAQTDFFFLHSSSWINNLLIEVFKYPTNGKHLSLIVTAEK